MSTVDMKVRTKQQASKLIFGYIHEHEKRFKHNVPTPINSKILEYYPILEQFKWQTGFDADEILKIYNNGLQVMNDSDNNRLCIANHKISDTECKEYSFEIKLLSFNYQRNYSGIMIGIVNASNNTSSEPGVDIDGGDIIKSFNTDFSTCNRDNSFTIYMSQGNQFFLYGPQISCFKLTEPIYQFKENDKIKIVLNMKKKEGYLYYNDKFVCNAFNFNNWNVVIPGLALWNSEIALNSWSIIDTNSS